MKEMYFKIRAADNNLDISCFEKIPDQKPKGIIQFSHGMAEHKERYDDFMNFLTKEGYITVILDHRGHGESILTKEDLGYFYEESGTMIVNDMVELSKKIKSDYPDLPLFIFSHSMGTLVARNYLKNHDDLIDGLVLSGAPYFNPMAPLGLALAKGIKKLKGDKYRSSLLQNMTFSSFNKEFHEDEPNRWLNSNMDEVRKYNNNPLCGYAFTINGFINLFNLMIDAFNKEDYKVSNPNLPIFFVAGEEDPVIGGMQNFAHTIQFIKDLGYVNVSNRLYFGMRHEILNEPNNKFVYDDILNFYK